MQKYFITLKFILISNLITAQLGEYFYILEAKEIQSIDVEILEYQNDSIKAKYKCLAKYSNLNRLDSVMYYEDDNILKSKYICLYLPNGSKEITTYFNQKDSMEIYRIEETIYGKHSSFQFTNNINNKGYEMRTIFDGCCSNSEKVWYVNDTLVTREIIENRYNKADSCIDFCSKSFRKKHNKYNSIFLTNSLDITFFEQFKVSNYSEERIGIHLISLAGDTLVTVETDSIKFLTEIKSLSNDSINYREVNTYSLDDKSANSRNIFIDTRDSTIQESYIFKDKNRIAEEANYFVNKVSKTGSYYYSRRTDIEGKLTESNSIKIKTYQNDEYGNWILGKFETNKDDYRMVKRQIRYNQP